MSALYFKYQAYDSAGKVQTGQLNADSEREAVKILQGRKLVPVKVQQSRAGESRGRRRKIKHSDLLSCPLNLPICVKNLQFAILGQKF